MLLVGVGRCNDAAENNTCDQELLRKMLIQLLSRKGDPSLDESLAPFCGDMKKPFHQSGGLHAMSTLRLSTSPLRS